MSESEWEIKSLRPIRVDHKHYPSGTCLTKRHTIWVDMYCEGCGEPFPEEIITALKLCWLRIQPVKPTWFYCGSFARPTITLPKEYISDSFYWKELG